MKTSKKILGAALALIMIFNVFAFGTFAAGTESAVDLYLSADKAAYVAGEEIILTVSEQVIDAVGDMRIGGQYPIAFDSSVFELVSTKSDLESHGFTAIQGGYDSSMSTIIASAGETIDEKNNWDALLFLGVADDFATAFDATNKVDLFTVKLKVKADAADGKYVIGFNQASFEGYTALVNDNTNSGIYGYADDNGYGTDVNYGLGTVEITVGAAAPSVVVTHKGTQSKWANGTPVAADYLFGFLGNVSGLELTTTPDATTGKNIVNEIAKIEATANIGGTTRYADVQTVWVDAKGGYTFRAQFAGFTPEMDTNVEVTFAITMKGENAPVYTTADAATATINGIYLQSVGNGLERLP